MTAPVPAVLRGRTGVLLATALACVLELLPGIPGLPRTLTGLWLLLMAPTLIWRGVAAKAVSSGVGTLVLALGLAVITDLLVALGVNTLLPLVGVPKPLTTLALASGTALTLILLGALLPELPAPPERGPRQRGPGRRALGKRPAVPHGLPTVLGFGAITLTLSVAGPIRLNNGLPGTVSTAAMAAVAGLLLVLLLRRREYSEAVVATGLYCAAASLLLLNSLRGWGISGHDIQREYEFFRLTYGGELWNVHAYPDAYNACLSITLLPVSLVRLTAIPDIYVFKVVLPLLFAFTPVLVHRSVRNVAPQLTALLSAVFFMAFPTFLSDMTFMGRQEIAFLLLGCTVTVLTDAGRPLRNRRLMFAALLAGIVLSHYSTTYMVVLTLGLAYGAELLWRCFERRPGRPRGRRSGRRADRRRNRHEYGRSFVTWWLVAVPAALALLWVGPVTHTGGQLQSTLSASVQELLHFGSAGSGSSDTSYSLVGGGSTSPAQRLAEYRTESVAKTAADRAAGDYLPLKTVEAYPTPVATQQDMGLTALGKWLGGLGVNVVSTNGLLRQGAAALLQVLLLLGVAVTLLNRRRSFRPRRDQITLTVAAVAVMGLLTVLPQLSVDYSVLRAFQQGLFFFAPFVAGGLLGLLRWTGRRQVPLALGLMALLLLDLTGVVPKVLGGYPPQLQLSNAGQYYDIYYPHAEERTAATWLEQRISVDEEQNLGTQTGVPVVQAERFTFNRLQTLITGPVVGDIYPTALGSNNYVLLGSATVRKDQATMSYQGDLVTYSYPMGLLDNTKDEIYSSDGAEVYR